MQELYHEEIKFDVGQVIQAKLWNIVYCAECYVRVSIGMAISVKCKFILLKGKAEDGILYQ
jgi:hypothetical protein